MAGYLWGVSAAQAAFDASLEKLTSELLPSSSPPDLLASLQLADTIRSSAVTPQAAAKSLLARLSHANPNVQLLALAVLDICIKNGGTPFLREVGAREFSNELETLARGKANGNRDVKEKVMAKLQDWAMAFKQKDGLRYTDLVKSYDRLKDEGLPFPPKDPNATAAMVDSLSAPEWTDGDVCTRCRTEFSTFNRKHHCRNCGNVFDQQCSSQTAPLPHFGITEPVRVCDSCIKKIKEGKGALARSNSLSPTASARPNVPERSSTVSYSSASSSKKSGKLSRRNKEEEDLQAAIAASLADVNPSSTSGPAYQLRDQPTSGYNPGYSSKPVPPSKNGEEDDPDLAAAIAASLRDVAPPPSAPIAHDSTASAAPAATYASLYPSTSSITAPVQAPKRVASLPSYDLTPADSSSLSAFSSTLERPPAVLSARERDLYESARQAVPRLERGLDDAQRRADILIEMNQKLGEAARLYEGLLDERVRAASVGSPALGYAQSPYGQPQPSYQYNSTAPTTSYPVAPVSYPQQPYALPYAPVPPSAHAPPSMGQPLPPLVTQDYQQHAMSSPPAQQHLQLQPAPPPESIASVQPQAQQQAASPPRQAQPHVPQPVGYYKPSSFPAVPSGPQAMLFPSVPQENPWENAKREEESRVGELIEL